MKKALFTVMVLFPFICFSQCKEIKDDFTGKTTKAYTIIIGGAIKIGDFLSFAKEEGNIKISYAWSVVSNGDFLNKVEETSYRW
jgi:hypothetical protein